MATLAYEIVDVFTDHPYAGNPLAVVLDADALTGDQLQAVAREFNLSETAFPVGSERADYRLRIFTPAAELPFAGHPSVGSAHTLVRLGRLAAGELVQECGAGLLPVTVTAEGAVIQGGRPELGDPLNAGAALSALGLGADDLDERLMARTAAAGLPFGFMPVREEALARTRPNQSALQDLGLGGGLAVVAWDGAAARVRMFACDLGVSEDPATGSAAVALGVLLAGAGEVGEGRTAYRVTQGVEMGRPSTLECTVTVQDGAVVATSVAGGVSPVARGEIAVPPTG